MQRRRRSGKHTAIPRDAMGETGSILDGVLLKAAYRRAYADESRRCACVRFRHDFRAGGVILR
jgi:hypothetical protein